MNFDKVVSVKTKPDQTDVEDKLKSLLVYREKKEWCDEKWGHSHKCPSQISRHVIEELFDALEQTYEVDYVASDEEIKIDVVMAVGDQLVQPSVKRRTMKSERQSGQPRCVDIS